MTLPPVERFLGVKESAAPEQLLGLTSSHWTAAQVDAALAHRLAMIDDHPDARSFEARVARQHLLAAAEALKAGSTPAPRIPLPARPKDLDAPKGLTSPTPPIPPTPSAPPVPPRADAPVRPPLAPPAGARRPARPAIRLTSFDQQVLAVLVSSRGWNAQARSRLVALASAYGITVQGLLKVVTGLSEYAKSGGPRLGVTDITAGRDRMAEPPAKMSSDAGPRTALLEQLGRQFDAERPGARLRLSAIFAAITVLAGILLLAMLLPTAKRTELAGERSPTARAESPADSSTTAPPVPPAGQEAVGEAVPPLRFQRFPTFQGNALPIEATEAADRCLQLPEQLDRLSRKLTVSAEASLADYRGWEDSVRTIGAGWVLVEPSTGEAIQKAIFDVLYVAADAPPVMDRLLEGLIAPLGNSGRPLDLWRGAWKAGTLGAIVANPSLPPLVVERARSQLEIMLPGLNRYSFRGAAGAWLSGEIPHLIRTTTFDEETFDQWELWFAAERELGGGARFDAVLMEVARQLLATGPDLSRAGPSLDLLGRILQTIDMTNSEVARQRMIALFNDPLITSSDLWVLTSCLAGNDKTPWFGPEFVVDHRADERLRRRMADLIEHRWEAVARPSAGAELARGRGIAVDGAVLAAWRDAEDELRRAPMNEDQSESLMERLTLVARLNAAACQLSTQHADEAAQAIEMIVGRLERSAESAVGTAAPAGNPPGSRRSRRPGQAIGPDGQWSGDYDQPRRSTDEQLDRLRALRSSAGSDLGPLDAAALVREAYRGSPAEIRSLAQSVTSEFFSSGPTVAMELLDQLPDAPINARLSEFIGQVTGRLLPSVRSASWFVDARLALLEHVLALRPLATSLVDEQAAKLADLYRARLAVLRRQPVSPSGGLLTPGDAAAQVQEYWQSTAALVMAGSPIPDDLPGLTRRHQIRMELAEGPIQRFVARQLAIAELLAYITVAEQPALGAEVRALLQDSSRRRDRLDRVLEQAVEAELLLARLWDLRLVEANRDPLAEETP